ncbi:MAG: sulfurtransferase [Armatimonadetes bacterium]|nr:sulfurtransferase [Armatimonadota bacterium]
MDTASNEQVYAHPERLVTTDWVECHLQDPNVIIVESNEDPLLYASDHIPGAFEVDWTLDLNDQIVRDYLSGKEFTKLMTRIGATPESHIVFYGDKGNWWACYALWVFGLFGHHNCSIMDGGRAKWFKELRPVTNELPHRDLGSYPVRERNDATDRAFRDEVLAHCRMGGQMVDVRSPEEFSGARNHMPEYPNEGALRGGHIPGAKSIPWATSVNAHDGTFRSRAELVELYEVQKDIEPGLPTITYCRIGERSAHTWFVLKFLLGHENVKNYDGSWTEWGNGVGLPIEKP